MVVLLIVVVVPLTVKSPVIVKLPPIEPFPEVVMLLTDRPVPDALRVAEPNLIVVPLRYKSLNA
jgi:hypothetical protein